MSATLDAAPVARYLGAPSLRSEGRLFDVAVEYLSPADAAKDDRLEDRVASAVRRLVSESPEGDVLVFLPGMAEIRRAAQACAPLAARTGLDVLPLHGDLSPEEQDRAVRPGSRRKVILSTNVAETSVTIEGVTAVVDSGLARVASHSPWSGLPRLEVRRVSKASATQRAGRAGRTAPGRCLRLYTRHDLDTRPEFDLPEILREDLSETLLSVASLGVGKLEWLDATPARRGGGGPHPASRPRCGGRGRGHLPARDGGCSASRSTRAWPGWWWRPTSAAPGRPGRSSPRCSPSGTSGSGRRAGAGARLPPAPPTSWSWPTSSRRRRGAASSRTGCDRWGSPRARSRRWIEASGSSPSCWGAAGRGRPPRTRRSPSSSRRSPPIRTAWRGDARRAAPRWCSPGAARPGSTRRAWCAMHPSSSRSMPTSGGIGGPPARARRPAAAGRRSCGWPRRSRRRCSSTSSRTSCAGRRR